MINSSIIILILIIIWYLFSYECFSYFNLNFDINDPISYNNIKDQYYNIPNINYSQNFIDDGFNKDNNNDNNINIFDNRIKLNTTAKYSYDKPKISNLMLSNKCCLIKKEFIEGKFSYNFNVLNDDACNLDLYELDQNNVLLFDGINGWSNNYCVKSNNILGSCRRSNMECIDFVTKGDCDNINQLSNTNFNLNFDKKNQNDTLRLKTVWSNKTCQDRVKQENLL